MAWIIPAILGVTSFLGGQQASSQAARANALAEQQVQLQKELLDYLLTKRKRLYDPIEENVVIPRMTKWGTSLPGYANEWLRDARRLRTPMTLPTEE
jgi:hypothetical protein